MPVHGDLWVPGDKSISHRAFMLGALAAGTTAVHRALDSHDVASTRRACPCFFASAAKGKRRLTLRKLSILKAITYLSGGRPWRNSSICCCTSIVLLANTLIRTVMNRCRWPRVYPPLPDQRHKTGCRCRCLPRPEPHMECCSRPGLLSRHPAPSCTTPWGRA